MGRKTITVPDAGESKSFPITGKSILVLSGGSYNRLTDFPKISFNDPGEDLPGVPRSTYQFAEQGCFDRVAVTGTVASAGDELILLTTNSCLGSQINTNIAETAKAIAGNSQTIQMDNSVQELTALQLVDSGGNLPRSIYISAGGTGDVHYRWNDGDGSDPSTGGDESYVLSPGDEPIEIQGIDFIQNKLKFINAEADETPYFIWTPRY